MTSKISASAAAFAVASLTALSLSACSGGGGVTATADATGPIKIGMVVPLTGPFSALGTGDQEAALRVVDQINADGGVDGRPIELTIVDDKTDPTESVKQFNQLASDPSYSAMLASTMVSAAAAVGSSIEQYAIPTIALSPVEEYADGSNAYAYTSPPTPSVYAQTLVDYWVDSGVETLAMTYSGGDLFGQLGQESTAALAQEAGIELILNEAYDPVATDFTPLVTKVADAAPDAFVIWGAGPGPVILTKQMEGTGIPLYGTGAQASNLFLDPAGPAAEGMIAATTAAMAGESLPDGPYKDAVMAVADPWLAANDGVYPPEFAFGGASAVQLLAAAIDAADSTDRAAINQQLTMLELLTPNGRYVYSPSDHMGLTSDALAIMVVHGGVWAPTPYALEKFATALPE